MVRRRWWLVAVLVVLGVSVAWYLGSPLFINRTIVEPFSGTADVARGTFTAADGFHKGQESPAWCARRRATWCDSKSSG